MSGVGAPIEMTRQNIAAQMLTTQQGFEAMQVVTGKFGVESVNQADLTKSALDDMKEEIGNSFTTHTNSHLKKMAVKAGQGTNLDAIKRITDYLDTLPDMPHGEKLEGLVKRFEQFMDNIAGEMASGGGGGGSSITADDILKALQEFDGDVTHQFAALEGALSSYEESLASREQTGAQSGADQTVRRFVDLLKQAQLAFARSDTARDVQAGFAMAAPASELAPTLETDPASLRDSYRAMLRETPTRLGQVFRALSNYDLSKNFPKTVEALTTAARTDLDAAHPSVDKRYLQELLTELSKMKQLSSVYDGVKEQIRLVGRLIPAEERARLDPGNLTAAVLDFANLPTANLSDARKLIGDVGTGQPAVQVNLANGIHELHGQLPDAVFPSSAARLHQGGVLDALLDEVGLAEEDSYAKTDGG